jgi:hypothetical protein
MRRPPIQPGTRVAIDIGQGLATARGIVTAAEYDDGWTYRIDVTDGNPCDAHRDGGELWVCDFEVTPDTGIAANR